MTIGNISLTIAVGGSVTCGLVWWGIKKFGANIRWQKGKSLFVGSVGSGTHDSGSVEASSNRVKGSMQARATAESGRFNDNKVDGDLNVDFDRK